MQKKLASPLGYCTFLGENLLLWFAVYDCLTFFFFSFLKKMNYF